jgi:broad specificity phosphatase PhoE
MKHLFFARHGLSQMNVAGLLSGSTDTPLTGEGRRQARQAGIAAKGLGIDLIVSSPLSRAHETAQTIAKEIGYPLKDIHTNQLLVERHFGELEGKPWKPDLNLDGITDIETVDTLLERAHLALKWLEQLPAQNILVVSHGSFGRALRSIVQKEFPFSHPHRLKNAEIYQWL